MARAQLELFPRDLIGTAPVSAAQQALAEALPARLYLGTSSWAFPGWRGIVYAREIETPRLAQEGLTAYARHPLLSGVGIDRTFYAPLSAESFAGYADQVPRGFRFLVKAHEHCTWLRFPMRPRYGALAGRENEHFLDADYATREVIDPLRRGLAERAGPLVFQFPPQGNLDPALFAELLHAFLRGLPKGPAYAVEIRNPRWLTPLYAKALAENRSSHCFTVHPSMPTLAAQRRALGAAAGAPRWTVVRWMLGGGQQYGAAIERYTPFDRLVDRDRRTREAITALCVDALEASRCAFVTVNNKAEGSAPLSAFDLAEAIQQAHASATCRKEQSP